MELISRKQPYTFHSQIAKTPVYVAPVPSPALELTIVLEGEINFLIDGRDHRVAGPAATMSVCRRSLGVAVDARRLTRAVWCNCRDVMLSSTEWSWLGDMPRALPVSAQLRDLFSTALRIPGHDDVVHDNDFGQRTRDALGIAVFNEFFRQTGLRPLAGAPGVQMARHHIDRHYAYDCDLGDLARIANLPPRRFARMFEREVGMSPVRYLWARRIEAGVRELKATHETVEEIAYRCGFQTAAHFSRRVKQALGVSPRELRAGR